MISGIIIIIFVAGYAAIAFEHKLKIDKAAVALLTGVLCWLFYFLTSQHVAEAEEQLFKHLADIAAILFFLMGAMTIVEVIDSHHGFNLITDNIKSRSVPKLLILITVLTFFLSAILDNLTTAIVMTSLSNKLIPEKKKRLWFVSMVIIAANAGGAWSPLGDVTTTMLWIGGQITAFNIIAKPLLPSIVVTSIPLFILCLKIRNHTVAKLEACKSQQTGESTIILFTCDRILICVHISKT